MLRNSSSIVVDSTLHESNNVDEVRD